MAVVLTTAATQQATPDVLSSGLEGSARLETAVVVMRVSLASARCNFIHKLLMPIWYRTEFAVGRGMSTPDRHVVPVVT
jgi:hypothetical protein